MILIAGPPGAGKSIQSQRLADELGVVWLSMGQLLRQSVDREVIDVMKEGKLLDDELVERVLSKAIGQVPQDKIILLDGFPRRQSQVEWFLDFIKEVDRELRCVVHIKIDLETSLERLMQRGRLDDKEDVIRQRYGQYEDEIVPMLNHLDHSHIAHCQIDGERDVDSVFEDIVSAVKDHIE